MASSCGDGDVCWFKCWGYPIWPGLKVSEARLPRHIKRLNNGKKVPFIYYGTKPLEWGFASSKDIFDFEINKEKYIKESKECPNKYKEQLRKAIAEAEIEFRKSEEERFKIIPFDDDDQSNSDDLDDKVSSTDDDIGEDYESEGNGSIHSSNDVDQVDNELGKILDAETIKSPSLNSDAEYSSYNDDSRMIKKRKLKEINKSRSKSNSDSLDTQKNKETVKKHKVKKNAEKDKNPKDKPLASGMSDIIKLKSTNIPVWQQLQQQSQQQKLSNSHETNLSQIKVDDSKLKRLKSFIKLLEQYRVNENMNAAKSLSIIYELEKDVYTYDELRLSKAAEFITNLRQSTNPNIASAASKLRNIWKSQCQKESACDYKNVSIITNKNVTANADKKPSVIQIDNILKNSNVGFNQLYNIKETAIVSTNESDNKKPVLEDCTVALDVWSVDKLTTEVKSNIYRCRSTRLIYDSIKRISVAKQLEELCFKKYWNNIPNNDTPPDCYLEHIRFVTFNVLEQHQYYMLQQLQTLQNIPNSLLQMLVNSYHLNT